MPSVIVRTSSKVLALDQISIGMKRAELLPNGLDNQASWLILLEHFSSSSKGNRISLGELRARFDLGKGTVRRLLVLMFKHGIVELSGSSFNEKTTSRMTVKGFDLVQKILHPD